MKKHVPLILYILMWFLCAVSAFADTPTQVDFLIGGLTDSSGDPLAGGKVYTYSAGTTSNKTTWQDAAKQTPHANPIVLDGEGKKLVYADGNYKFRIDDSANETKYTLDNLKFGEYSGSQLWAGTATEYTSDNWRADVSPPILAYSDGLTVSFRALVTNTSNTTTLALNGLSAIQIRKSVSEGLRPEDMVSGRVYTVIYIASDGYFMLINPATGGWTSYTPTLIPSGSMTYSSTSVTHASYQRVGRTIHYKVAFTGTVGGTPDLFIRFTLPVAMSATTNGFTGFGYVFDNGAFAGAMVLPGSTSGADCYRSDRATLTAGTFTCSVAGFYEAS